MLTDENFRLDITGKSLDSDRLKELIKKFCTEVGITISNRQFKDHDVVFVTDSKTMDEYTISFSLLSKLFVTVEYTARTK